MKLSELANQNRRNVCVKFRIKLIIGAKLKKKSHTAYNYDKKK